MTTQAAPNQITPELMDVVMVSLGERFGREISAPLCSMYHQSLEPMLTRAEFEQAVRVVIAEDVWFPSPARIIEAATSSVDDQAALAWSEILCANREDRAHEIDQHARASLTDLGGSHMIQTLTGDNILRFRTAFLTEYARRARAARVEMFVSQPALLSSEQPSVVLFSDTQGLLEVIR